MVSKNLKLKRICCTIIVIFLIFCILNLAATKIIYDKIFTRYDCTAHEYQNELLPTVHSREKISFASGENTLCGYLYKSSSDLSKDTLIVLSAGHNACSESYLWQIKELVDSGWSVFAFDPTGCCESGGKSAIGFSQELLDLKGALSHIEKNNRFGYNNIALLGHSRGGYAACCALSYDYDISAVICISGINSAMEGVIGSASEYVGMLAYLNYPFLWFYQSSLFGSDTVNLKANNVLSNCDVPVLVVHGADDTKVPTDKFSIYSYKDTINRENIEYLLCSSPQNSGHTDLLFDKDTSANDELIKKINEFLEKSLN